MCSFPPLNIFISSELTEKDALYHKLMCSWYISSCGENRSDGQGGRLLQVSLTFLTQFCFALFALFPVATNPSSSECFSVSSV